MIASCVPVRCVVDARDASAVPVPAQEDHPMRPLRPSPGSPGLTATLLLATAAAVVSCAPAEDEPGADEATSVPGPNRMVELLASGQPVFGIFSGEHTPGQGARMARNREADFVFYSLESGPFDIPAMEGYMEGMREGAGEYASQPVALRIPPIRDGADSARVRARAGTGCRRTLDRLPPRGERRGGGAGRGRARRRGVAGQPGRRPGEHPPHRGPDRDRARGRDRAHPRGERGDPGPGRSAARLRGGHGGGGGRHPDGPGGVPGGRRGVRHHGRAR